MNTIILNQSSFKVNTLTDISNKKSHYNNYQWQKLADIHQSAFGGFVDNYLEEQKQKRLIRITVDEKIKLLPAMLFEEIEKLVLSKYRHHVIKIKDKDDFRYCWHNYFNDVSLYFNTFTFTEIFLCNADDEDMKAWELAGVCSKRQFRKLQGEKLYHASVLLRLIGGDTNKRYCCDSLIKEYQSRYVKQQNFIRNSALVKEDGQVLKMKNCIKTLEMHIAELINYINTIEEISSDKGMDWTFITLTLPPEYHPNPTHGENSYAGMSPRQANTWYSEKVNLVRAKLRKLNLLPDTDFTYIKVCEAHKDGCPHWHILFWCKPQHLHIVKDIFFEVFPNLAMNSKKSWVQNNGLAKAGTYIFKYITKTTSIVDLQKNIYELHGDEYNTLLNSAFRSFNRIRGINFSGVKKCKRKFQFLARNYKQLNIIGELADILENNDLKTFMLEWADKISNVYRKNSSGNNVFIGVKLDGLDYIKSFFKVVRSEHDGDFVTHDFKNKTFKNSEKRKLYRKIAKLTKFHVLSEKVLVNHNYTSESQKQTQNPKTYQTDWQNYDDWLRSKIIFNS